MQKTARHLTPKALLLLVLCLLSTNAWAQSEEPVPDTLDWHGYFPLAVGNVWQYDVETFVSFGTGAYFETWRALADTTINAETYVVLEVTCNLVSVYPGPDPTLCEQTGSSVRHRYIRHDEASRNVVESVENPDGTVEDRWFWRYDFRLDAPFESTNVGTRGEYEYVLDDEVQIAEETVQTTVKEVDVYSAVPGGLDFAYGIGMIYSRFAEAGGTERELVYARIGETEYGTLVRVASEPTAQLPEKTHLAIYPNPARERFSVEFALSQSGRATLRLYDLLGREQGTHDLGYRAVKAQIVSIADAGLSSGVYHLVLSVEGRPLVSRPLVIVR